MDVTCERCGTEYEFDETLVSDRGTTVKCTNCGHLFKVFRPGAGPGGEDRSWSIRTRSGTTLVLGSLRELQKLITQGELTEEDEISRSGEGWKPLGSIAELQTFFAAARTMKNSTPPQRRDGTLPFETGPAATPFQKSPSAAPPPGAQRSAKGTIMGVGAGSTPPPAARPSGKGTMMGVGTSAPPPPRQAPPPPAARVPTEPIRPAPPPAHGGAGATVDQRPRQIAPTREAQEAPISHPPAPKHGRATAPLGSDPGPAPSARPPSARPPSAAPARKTPSAHPARPSDRPARPLYVDDEENLRPAKKSRAGLWIGLVVVLVLVGAGVGLAWNRVAPVLGLGGDEDPLAPFLESGAEALAGDHPEAYERAMREYTRGTAIAERDPRLLAGLARAHGLLAQSLAFHASDLEARAGQDPALAGEAAALRREQRRNAEDARRLAEDAVRQSPNDVSAVLALADALRMNGDPSGARSHLSRAATLERDPSAEQLYVAALLDMDAAGNVAAARDKAAEAVARDGELIRARLLYARALLAEGNVAQARGQIDSVLNDHPDHPEAKRLRDAIEQGLPPAAPVVAVLDGGPAVDAGAGAVAEEPPSEATEARGGGGGGGVPAGRDYSWYIGQGERSLEGGNPGRARQYFEAALAVRSTGPEALWGLGYVLLDTGNAAGAKQRFQQAANQGYAPAFIGLGTANQRLGNTRAAIEAFESYLARMPGGAEASIARRQLDALRREAGAGGETGGGTPEGGATGEPPGEGTTGGTTGGEGTTEGTEAGGSEGAEAGGTEPAPPTPPGTLPAPRGTDPENPPPSTDPPAVGSEP